MTKRGLAWALTVMTVMGLLAAAPGVAPAARAGYGSNGKFLAPIEAPYGTAISNRAQLEAIRNNLGEIYGNYYLAADIDLSGAEWKPIGTVETPFKGTFDGQGHVIRNMTITGNVAYAGLFGVVPYNSIIKNVGMENTYINITSADKYASAGGVCGDGSQAHFINCYNMGSVSASASDQSWAGGICGRAPVSMIISCYNTGDVFASDSLNSYAGGLCSYGSGISKSYNVGDVSASASSVACAGGINGGGHSYWNNLIENCYNTGDVSASSSYRSYAGGICDSTSYSIRRCYNIGGVSVVPSSSPSCAGGICGSTSSSANVSNSYCLNLYDSSLGTQLTAAQMKSASSYVGFDFATVWDISPTFNGGYPFLRGQDAGGGESSPQTTPPAGYSSWAAEELTSLFNRGVIPSGLLSNYKTPIHRDEFIALLINVAEAARQQSFRTGSEFTDIGGIIYKPQIEKGFQMGIINGKSKYIFDPLGTLTREQAAKMISLTVQTVNGGTIPRGNVFMYNDRDKISSWAVDYVTFCYDNKLMLGMPGDLFEPKGNLTREQAMCVAERLIANYGWTVKAADIKLGGSVTAFPRPMYNNYWDANPENRQCVGYALGRTAELFGFSKPDNAINIDYGKNYVGLFSNWIIANPGKRVSVDGMEFQLIHYKAGDGIIMPYSVASFGPTANHSAGHVLFIEDVQWKDNGGKMEEFIYYSEANAPFDQNGKYENGADHKYDGVLKGQWKSDFVKHNGNYTGSIQFVRVK